MKSKIMNTTQYTTARKMLDAYERSSREYCEANNTNGIPGDVTKKFPYADKVNNDLRSAIEIYEFMHNIPESYMVYINEEKRLATTWTGEKLGAVTGFGLPYRDNFGGQRVAITINAINGKVYHGTFYRSSGDYARIKLYKNQ